MGGRRLHRDGRDRAAFIGRDVAFRVVRIQQAGGAGPRHLPFAGYVRVVAVLRAQDFGQGFARRDLRLLARRGGGAGHRHDTQFGLQVINLHRKGVKPPLHPDHGERDQHPQDSEQQPGNQDQRLRPLGQPFGPR
ncbi:hypothetical protein NO221_15490 [Gluconacetobacter entanii]|nr:hypothetical protein [Gluconacetobacter entanii]MCW4585095.1 hypothetical protein [Gluconacetobacter entanii]MCW4588743.1 hypothetical protein [Gluconacetobacter entanii]